MKKLTSLEKPSNVALVPSFIATLIWWFLATRNHSTHLTSVEGIDLVVALSSPFQPIPLCAIRNSVERQRKCVKVGDP